MKNAVDRRHFLKLGSASLAWSLTGLAGLSGSGLRSARAGENTGRIKKAVKYSMIHEKISVVDKFKLLQDLGFDGVEVATWDKTDKEQFAKARDETGLPIHGVIHANNPDIPRAIDLAKFYGGSSVLVVAGSVNKKNSYDRVYQETQARFREAVPYAEKQEIKLLLENVWNNFLLSPLEMAEYIDALQSPWFGAYFDIGNVIRYGFPEQWIRILGHRIGKLDIKDYSRDIQLNKSLRAMTKIGDGDADWPAVRQALADIGYQGWGTAEVNGGDRTRLKEIADRMDAALDL